MKTVISQRFTVRTVSYTHLKGYAYEKNGTVYFRTRKFDEYGKLSHKNLDDLQSGGRSPVSYTHLLYDRIV